MAALDDAVLAAVSGKTIAAGSARRSRGTVAENYRSLGRERQLEAYRRSMKGVR